MQLESTTSARRKIEVERQKSKSWHVRESWHVQTFAADNVFFFFKKHHDHIQVLKHIRLVILRGKIRRTRVWKQRVPVSSQHDSVQVRNRKWRTEGGI